METYFSTLIIISQVLLLFFIPFTILRSFHLKKREELKFKALFRTLEIALFILLIVSFYLYDMSSFNKEIHFPEFAMLAIFSASFYWINKLNYSANHYYRHFIMTFIASFFWLALFTSIKFFPYMQFVWFPGLGILAIGPFLLAILSLSEIRYYTQRYQIPILKILAFGLIPLLIAELIISLYTTENWAFIALFNPANTNPTGG